MNKARTEIDMEVDDIRIAAAQEIGRRKALQDIDTYLVEQIKKHTLTGEDWTYDAYTICRDYERIQDFMTDYTDHINNGEDK